MPIHKIDLKELREWKLSQKIIYASCSTKRLFFYIYGSWEIEIYKNNKWVLFYQGMQNLKAVEQYNDLP